MTKGIMVSCLEYCTIADNSVLNKDPNWGAESCMFFAVFQRSYVFSRRMFKNLAVT